MPSEKDVDDSTILTCEAYTRRSGVPVPLSALYAFTAFETSSGPLSARRCAGAPRIVVCSSSTDEMSHRSDTDSRSVTRSIARRRRAGLRVPFATSGSFIRRAPRSTDPYSARQRCKVASETPSDLACVADPVSETG